jgi:zinc transport system substrate-binding protein
MHLLPVLLSGLTVMATAGCAAASSAADSDRLQVLAGFFPLQYVAERVGGDAADVTNLTPPGAESHNLELTPSQVAGLGEADLVVYLGGFAPAVDTAVEAQAQDRAFDVGPSARLTIAVGEHDHEHEDGEHEDGEHEDGEHEDGEGGIDGMDPHFWLDPMRVADVGDALADRLAAVDPARAAEFEANADALRADLTGLDERFRAGTTDCSNRFLVVSHEAFGYLGQAYDFEQVGIAGINPDQEPSAGTLARISDFVRDKGIATVYSEVLVSPAVAQTVAQEAGVELRVLDPIEGLTDASAATDYVGLMEANLAELRAGQPCR